MLWLSLMLGVATATLSPAPAPPCHYDAAPRYSDLASYVFVKPCSAADATQRWAGSTLLSAATTSELTNAGAPAGWCLSALERDPVAIQPCAGGSSAEGATFLYNHTNLSVALVAGGAVRGLCLDVNHGSGPDVDFYACHGPVRQQRHDPVEFAAPRNAPRLQKSSA